MVNIALLGKDVEPTFDEMCYAYAHADAKLFNNAEHRSGWEEIYDQSQAVLMAILEEAQSNVVEGKTFCLTLGPKGLAVKPIREH